jgi:serine/threonine-protein kinase
MTAADIPARLSAALAGRYRIERELGRGGMADVYLAEDVRHGRHVALKVLRPELAATLGAERFLREIRMAAGLTHPHIVPLYDSGEADGMLYYVMPHIDGESLRQRLDREKQLPVDEAVDIARQVASALEYAHAEGLIHRDIKPANVLLRRGEARVTDFGVAIPARTAAADRLTESGISVGTLAYMSPEQAMGHPDADERTDVYSLACVLFEMLCGEPPHSAPTAQALLAKIVSQRPIDVSALRPAVPPALSRAVSRALEKNAVDRFASVRAFSDALSSQAEPHPAARRSAVPRVIAAAALLAAVAGLAWWAAARRDGSAPEASAGLDPARIAVLYFDDFSPGGQLGHLAEGFTESLIHELSQVSDLTVISRFGVRPFRNADVSIDSIVRTLGVGTLVEGSLERDGDQLRATVQLIDGSTAAHLLSRQVERAGTDLLDLRDAIVREVADLLRQRLGEEIRIRQRRARAENDVAWELTRRAERELEPVNELLRAGDGQAAARAIARADSLLAAAADSAAAWTVPRVDRARLAASWAFYVGTITGESDTARAVLGRGHAALGPALGVDRPDPAVIAARGRLDAVHFLFSETQAEADSLAETAERDLRAALAADPDMPTAWSALSELLQMSGRFTEARQAARRAYEADPFMLEANQILQRLCATSLELNEIDEALAYCREGRRRFPQDANFVVLQLYAYPDIETAWTLVDTARRIQGATEIGTPEQLIMAGLLATAGLRDSADHVLERALTVPPDVLASDVVLYIHAWVRLQIGQSDSAIAILRRYLDLVPSRRAYISSDMAFRPLRDDPRFQELVDPGRE